MRMFLYISLGFILISITGCSGPGLEPMELVSTFDEAEAQKLLDEQDALAAQGDPSMVGLENQENTPII